MSTGLCRIFLSVYFLALCYITANSQDNFNVTNQWAELDFVFPNAAARQKAINAKFYIPGKSLPIDVEVFYGIAAAKPKVFITIPRFGEGRPITLGTVGERGRISGYPNYAWNDNQGKNCDGLTSVFRVTIDKFNRLWVMDAGKIGDNFVCSPQLLAFDLNNNNIIYRHRPKSSTVQPTSLYVTPVVDIRGQDISNTFVYVADIAAFGLLVVDVAKNLSWWITQRYFYPYPSHATITVNNESFDIMDGILGMAMSPDRVGEDRNLFYHALASVTENVVKTSILKNSSIITNTNLDLINTYANLIKVLPGRRPTQSAAEAMDDNGIMYFGQMDPPSIWCWNSGTKFTTRNFHLLAVNNETLQFASGIKLVSNCQKELEVWVLTNRFQKFAKNTLTSDTINYRILTAKVSTLLRNSPCRLSSKL